MKNAIFVISGNCRSFLDCLDTCYDNIMTKMFDKHQYNLYAYFYLKLTDPGPKGQSGWNYTYKNVEKNKVIDKIKEIKDIGVDYKILDGNEISDNELLSQVKNRLNYISYYGKDNVLLRGMHCHYNLEMCGKFIIEKEKEIRQKFDFMVYIRPDLYFTEKCKNIESYDNSKITLGEGPNYYNNDHIAIVPSEHFQSFFFDRMKVYRTNETKSFDTPESVYWHTIKFKTDCIGKYFIKRNQD